VQILIRTAMRPHPIATAVLIGSSLLSAACGQGSASPPAGSSTATPAQLEQTAGPSTPAGLAEPRTVPPGWKLQLSFEQQPGPPVIWVRVYAPAVVPDTGPFEGPGRLVVYQAFGLSNEWTGTRAEKARASGAEQFPVAVNGQSQPLWHIPSSGELLLGWTQERMSLALVGNAADLSAAELVAIAQGLVPAP
jgi:hypothetical protein